MYIMCTVFFFFKKRVEKEIDREKDREKVEKEIDNKYRD